VAKIYTYRELVKKLKKYDPNFQTHQGKGKGSERMLYHPDINGRPESYPLKCHGESTEIKIGHYAPICSRFNLPKNFFNNKRTKCKVFNFIKNK